MSTISTFLIAVVTVLIGFVLLIKGADAFVEGSSAIARKLKIPSIVIGLTIVAMGTSLPELAVSVTAAISGSNSLAISNVTGSNIFNLMVVLGFSALFVPLTVSKDTLKSDLPFSVICALLLIAFGVTGTKADGTIGTVGRIEGVVFLILFIGFITRQVKIALKSRNSQVKSESEVITENTSDSANEPSMLKCILMIIIGGIAIKFGGDFVVGSTLTLPSGLEIQYGSTAIARILGMSETLIGLTIVACGTSLPELVTSIVAARKNEVDMAVGNVIGSNIFNILFILGVASVISPVVFITENIVDLVILIVFSLLVWCFTWTKQRLVKGEGIVMIVLYAIYLVYICIR